MDGALKGIRVIDLTRVLAGPYCSMILGDLGAEVIKIEIPGVGDDSRAFPPFVENESVYFLSLNRNKKSITLNLKSEKGKELFLNMVKKSHVVVENFRPGTMEKLGLGYEELKKANPKIIYAASSGFGHTGPYSHKPAYDMIVQAMGGIMSITGPDENTPTKVGASIGDIISGMFTAIGILAGLNHMNNTGVGQKVDVAMLDCQVAVLENAIARYLITGKIPRPIGNRHPSITPFGTYKSKDSEIVIAIGNDRLWEKFCKIVGKEELIEDERFKTNSQRTENVSQLEPILSELIKCKTTMEWISILEREGIPCSPINNVKDVIEDPQVIERNMIVEVEHKSIGKVKIPGNPIKMSETPGTIDTSAPMLGEHTADILKSLCCLTDEEIKGLYSSGVI